MSVAKPLVIARLTYHQVLHTERKPTNNECGKVFIKPSYLRHHERIHTERGHTSVMNVARLISSCRS